MTEAKGKTKKLEPNACPHARPGPSPCSSELLFLWLPRPVRTYPRIPFHVVSCKAMSRQILRFLRDMMRPPASGCLCCARPQGSAGSAPCGGEAPRGGKEGCETGRWFTNIYEYRAVMKRCLPAFSRRESVSQPMALACSSICSNSNLRRKVCLDMP